MKSHNLFAGLTLAMVSVLGLTACGSSGDSGGSSTTATVSGTVFAGPVGGAQVSVKSAGGSVIAGPATTNADGSFTLNLDKSLLGQALRFEANGGNFTDEATGTGTPGGKLCAWVPASSLAGGQVNLDPSTTIIHDLVVGGRSLDEAMNLHQGVFGFKPDFGKRPALAPAQGTADDNLLRGLRVAAFSQLTKDLGLSPAQQFNLVSEIAQDLSDGTLDGKKGATALTFCSEDLACRYANAMAAFLDSANNQTGLTPDKIGTPPFGKVLFTKTYKVEYLPGDKPAIQGKTQFKIKVTDKLTKAPVTGLVASGFKIFPYMHMATKSHSSPMDDVITDNGDGTYSATVYFLMPNMMNGISMGFWDLKITIGQGDAAEIAVFHPIVGMGMGTDTIRAVLKGQNDSIATITGPAKRSYFIFRDGVTGTNGDHTVGFFLATTENMMKYPSLYQGIILHDQDSTAWTVDTVALTISSDGSTWLPATNVSGGHWAVSGVAGMTSGTQTPFSVKLTVNADQKTTDGNAPTSATDHADFNVTP